MSGCGNSNCSCGNSCSCGSNCSCGSKKTMDIQEVTGMEGFECDKDGCKCGTSCACTNCNCT